MNMPSTIRVATWNLWWKHGPWEQRQQALGSVLASVGADVVGLQEMSFRDPDQLPWLVDRLGGHGVVAPRDGGMVDAIGRVGSGARAAEAGPADGSDDDATAGVGRIMGNAIWSRWPIVESEWCWLDVGDAPRHRTVLWARIAAPMGPLDVFTTHLSHGFHQSGLRTLQVAELVAFVAERRGPVDAGFPPILLGDLNAVPESDEIRSLVGLSAPAVDGLIFSDAWAQVGDGPGATWSAGNPYVVDSAWPERRLDYVLVGWPRARPAGNPVRARLFGTDPIDGVMASDHYGVAVDLVAPVG